jgi:hypothetical protein
MKAVLSQQAGPATEGRSCTGAARPFASRRLLWAAGAGGIALALAFGWQWLTAIGIASALVSVLPCVAMCALGLCMNKGAKGSCHDAPAQTPGAKSDMGEKK